jgi:glycosyltransferase involved in cell wall biosynthesis
MAIGEDNPPTYAIFMVVHNALEMVHVATLRTLRHTAGQDVRFLVVDGGSNDGSEIWLQLLAARGDIQLIRAPGNIGHGPGLELARRSSRSRFIVTLDSDAFPLSDAWLETLRQRLQDGSKAAGIRHHRDYIHPSCLMLERATLDEMQLNFLNEKDRPAGLDVAERISVEIKARGFRIAGLQRTAFRRRGSLSEPVDLGATYEDTVYHHWYTTRSEVARSGPVDDVRPDAIADSLEELFTATHAEHRDATIVVGLRARPGEDRAQNATACLRALNLQEVARWRYRITLVEQDSEPRLKTLLAPYVDRYLFAYNPSLYNRGWAFNAGARQSPATGALCLIDADLLTPRDFVGRALQEFERGTQALLPYQEILHLDTSSTARAIAGEGADNLTGQLFDNSHGGAVWVSAELYRRLGGHDERFQGWGYEDREFYHRLNRIAGVRRMPGRLHHLHHRDRDSESSEWAVGNRRLFQRIEIGRAGPPPGDPGNLRRYVPASANEDNGADRARDWQNWHAWAPDRIRAIVNHELSSRAQVSPRAILAGYLARLGSSLLDVGCGPGALWPRLLDFRELSCVGVDVTGEMLSVARQKFPGVPVCQADAAQLPFHDSRFDVVLLRHVLEHLPPPLKDAALNEAMRVAGKAVALDFYVPPSRSGERDSRRLPGNFLETRWTAEDLLDPASKRRWNLRERFALRPQAGESNEVWVLEPLSGRPVYSAGPKVSIIMPTFRRPHTLMRTIETVRAQRYSNWELLVVDNAGDGAYLFGDPRIHVHILNERASASYARNAAIGRATGELICFFDDDDDMFPDYLEKLVAALQAHPEAKMVRCGMIVTGGAQNYSYATPECCVRREFATATWESCGCHDQVYFAGIAERNGWSLENGSIVMVREALCRANSDGTGGLREGAL